jgi:hypothetical protein
VEAGYKWKDNIKMDQKEIEYENADWTYVPLLASHERHFRGALKLGRV